MKTSHFFLVMSIGCLFTSCATGDPVAAKNAGEGHFLARGGREWQAEKAGAHPKGLIWRVNGRPKAVMVCLHGIQTHSAWFGPLAAELNGQGWTVIAPDRRGSGLNSDAPFVRGHTRGENELFDDLEAQIKAARREADGMPVYLLGTSWGSNLAGAYVTQPNRAKPDGMIQLVPATKVRQPHTPGLFGKLFLGAASVVAPEMKTSLRFGPRHYLAGHDQAALVRDRRGNLPPVPARGEEPAPAGLAASNSLVLDMLERDSKRQEGALLIDPTVRTLVTGNQLNKQWTQRSKELLQAGYPLLVITADRDQIMDNAAAVPAFEMSGKENIARRPVNAGHAVQITHAKTVAREIVRWAETKGR